MSDEPTLPPLPAGPRYNHENHTLRSFRKRVRGSSGLLPFASTSSDPAVFSSDDDPGLDNYVHGRRKRRYIGTWFNQQPASGDSGFGEDSQPLAKPPRRQLKRQMDSGVWMGSDASNETDDLVPLEIPSMRRPELFLTKPPNLSAAEQIAMGTIEQCVEDGAEVVDLRYADIRNLSIPISPSPTTAPIFTYSPIGKSLLTQHSALGLEELSNSTIEPLSSLALIPTVAEDVPFEHKEPHIKLYLAKNSLSRVPGAVFRIENLTVLSLRGNCLGELPPSIGKLRNLQALNVAQNKLKCLPAELLSLVGPRGSLEDLVLHPNPFFQPDNLPSDARGSLDYETLTFGATDTKDNNTLWTGYSTSLRSRSPVQFSDSTGTIYSDFHLEPTASKSNLIPCEDFCALDMPNRAPWQSRSQAFGLLEDASTRVPTLFELALRAASQAPEIEELADQVAGVVPQHIPPILKRAAKVRETGGQSCCICHRQVVIPQTEWLEWRQVFHRNIIYDSPTSTRPRLDTDGNQDGNTIWVPFIRKGCSWKCVPQTAKKSPQSEYAESEPFEP